MAKDVRKFIVDGPAALHPPRFAWLRVNRLVKTDTAMKIAELLSADDTFDGKRNG